MELVPLTAAEYVKLNDLFDHLENMVWTFMPFVCPDYRYGYLVSIDDEEVAFSARPIGFGYGPDDDQEFDIPAEYFTTPFSDAAQACKKLAAERAAKMAEEKEKQERVELARLKVKYPEGS